MCATRQARVGRRIASTLALLLLPCMSIGAGSAPSAPLGVYKSNGCTGVERLPEFVSWFGREPDFILDFFDVSSWKAMMDDAGWTVRCWAKTGRAVVFSVPMLVRATPDTLADGAAGKFDDKFRSIAELLVKYGYGRSIIRLGWEFNGRDFYPWAAAKDPENFVRYWRRIVSVMRSVEGAGFRFDWCFAQGKQEIEPDRVYPGDDVVDIIGQDLYNQTWTPGVTTPEQRWNELLNQPYGLRWHREFARARRKPMSFPEWGTMTRNDGRGGGDDAYFIERMAAWIADNDVAYHAYWDHSSRGYKGKLSDGHHPKAAAAFLEHFARPAEAPRIQLIELPLRTAANPAGRIDPGKVGP